jgi:hypothetical protein
MTRLRKATLSVLGVATAVTMGVSLAGPATGVEQAPRSRVAVAEVLDEPVTSLVTGTWTGRNNQSGTVTGTFTPKKFGHNGSSLTVRGVLDMVLADAQGNVVREVSRRIVQPVTKQAADAGTGTSTAPTSYTPAGFTPAAIPVPEGCDILNLVLGPLDLNLLGLAIVLQQVQLDIVAVPGAGALLGNLLCAVAGLLDGGFSLGLISDILNTILQIIQGLGGLGGVAGRVSPASV